jgi:DNA-binding NarL/FixJ family response regulator
LLGKRATLGADCAENSCAREKTHSCFNGLATQGLQVEEAGDASLLSTIRQLQPEASIVVMTAFSDDDVVEKAIALGARTVLNKPFALGAVVDAVRLDWC